MRNDFKKVEKIGTLDRPSDKKFALLSRLPRRKAFLLIGDGRANGPERTD